MAFKQKFTMIDLMELENKTVLLQVKLTLPKAPKEQVKIYILGMTTW